MTAVKKFGMDFFSSLRLEVNSSLAIIPATELPEVRAVSENTVRYRLVGALVMVSLAVIFVPMILSGEGEIPLTSPGATIPPEPDYRFTDQVVQTPVEEPVRAEAPVATVVESIVAADVDTESVAPLHPDVPAETQTAAAPQEPIAIPKGVSSWSVQVASFSNKKNAVQMRDMLRAKNYSAYVEEIKTSKGLNWRVRVGPELQRPLAEKLVDRIEKDTGQQGLVVSHRAP